MLAIDFGIQESVRCMKVGANRVHTSYLENFKQSHRNGLCCMVVGGFFVVFLRNLGDACMENFIGIS